MDTIDGALGSTQSGETNPIEAAESLEGRTVKDDWVIGPMQPKLAGATGGHFSVGYVVKNKKTGKEGFLKALKLSAAKRPGGSQDVISLLQEMLDAFKYERDICRLCKDAHMDRVVTPICDDVVVVDNSRLEGQVPFIIFERAKHDIRKQMIVADRFDEAVSFRTLHQISVGLRQLHNNMIRHTDLKPSNVLWFDDVGSKVGDLGRSTSTVIKAPHDSDIYTGDLTYAPLDILFGFPHADRDRARKSCDLYQLGNLAVFLFGRLNITTLVLHHMGALGNWRQWSEPYQQAEPYIVDAYGKAIGDVSAAIPEIYRKEAMEVIKELCEPDPRRRGDPADRSSVPYSLERYISRFDRLATQARVMLQRGV